MDRIVQYRDLIIKILNEHAAVPYSYGSIEQYVIVDQAQNHVLLFHEGWDGQKRRVHGCGHCQLKGRSPEAL